MEQAEAVAEAAAEEIVEGAEDAPSKLSDGEGEGEGGEDGDEKKKTAKPKSKGGGPCEAGPHTR